MKDLTRGVRFANYWWGVLGPLHCDVPVAIAGGGMRRYVPKGRWGMARSNGWTLSKTNISKCCQ
eukprot:8917687-Pyramimonas_sp.AAC.1